MKWGTSSDTPAKPDWDEGTHGKIVFTIYSHGTTGGNASIDDTGVISGTENVGEITVTVAIEGGTKYAAGDVGTFKVTFIQRFSIRKSSLCGSWNKIRDSCCSRCL